MGLSDLIDKTQGSQTFAYTGNAFNGSSTDGILNYEVNFASRQGSGTISGLGGVNVTLARGNVAPIKYKSADGVSLDALGITNSASFSDSRANGTYTLGIFGNDASEIAGYVTEKDAKNNNINTIGFGGSKQ